MSGELDTNGSGVIADMIRQRAYEISQGPDGGTPEENWARAERELRGELQREALDGVTSAED
jgi:Protein of unknown function (DUF2934)